MPCAAHHSLDRPLARFAPCVAHSVIAAVAVAIAQWVLCPHTDLVVLFVADGSASAASILSVVVAVFHAVFVFVFAAAAAAAAAAAVFVVVAAAAAADVAVAPR